MTAPLDEAAMRERHTRVLGETPSRCRVDEQSCPCDAIQALDALALAERVVDAARVLPLHSSAVFDKNAKTVTMTVRASVYDEVMRALAAHDAEAGR